MKDEKPIAAADAPRDLDPVYYYECQEMAMAPGIGDGWPAVINAPHTKNARLVRREGDPSAIIAALRSEKDTAYTERNALVAALSKLLPASLERHSEADVTWEDDWRWIVFVDLPTGQATWHIHDSELCAFDHLPRRTGRAWDGHSTPEKYTRLAAMEPQP
jgi:hypothetical protein